MSESIEQPDSEPDFEKCGNCEADAKNWCYWNNALGWTCLNCGATDADE